MIMELSLDLSLVYAPKTISECLREVSKVKDGSLKASKLDDYVKRLEDEMRKIDAFKRELPLCVLLLNDAIVRLKEEAMRCKEMEILSAKDDSCRERENDLENDMIDKKNWLSSVQLWNNNNNINFDSKKEDSKSETKQRSEDDDDRSTCENPVQMSNYISKGEEFNQFMPYKSLTCGLEVADNNKEEKEVVSKVNGLSLMTTTTVSELGSSDLVSKISNSNQQQQQQPSPPCKKQRRCWSPELHRRFVDALQQLGGSQVATPKQIRELMQVDGLTNDEVKSHLQKYRLHIRKLPASSSAQANALPTSCSEHKDALSKQHSVSQSNSPQGPFHRSRSARGMHSTGGESMEAEDDDQSDSNSWNDTQ